MYFKDSSGSKSLTATITIISFFVVMVKVLLSGASISIGSSTYSFGAIDSMTVGAILGPILGAYTFRRYSDNRYPPPPVSGAGGRPSDGAA